MEKQIINERAELVPTIGEGRKNGNTVHPVFAVGRNDVGVEDIMAETETFTQTFEPLLHEEIMNQLLDGVPAMHFRKAGIPSMKNKHHTPSK